MIEKLAYDIEAITMEKLANRARELMRMGKLSPQGTQELLSKGMLPNTRAVTRGMERGSDALMRKHNIRNMDTLSLQDIEKMMDHYLATTGITKAHSAYNSIHGGLVQDIVTTKKKANRAGD